MVIQKGHTDVKATSRCDITSDHLKLKTSDVLANLGAKLGYLSSSQQIQFISLIRKFANLFPDVPQQTTLVSHDVEAGDCRPIKQHPHCINPVQLERIKKELIVCCPMMLLSQGPSKSEWSSLCLLVVKEDGSYRFCTNFREVNY